MFFRHKPFLALSLFFANKYLTLLSLVFIYLFLSPFYIHTYIPSQNLVKSFASVGLSILILSLFIGKRIISVNFSLRISRHVILLVLFFAWALISTIISPSQHYSMASGYGATSFSRVSTIIGMLIVMFACLQILDEYESFLTLIKAFYYSFFIALIGVFWNIYHPYMPSGISTTFFRFYSFCHDPNIFGQYLVLIILMSVIFMIRDYDAGRTLKLRYSFIGVAAAIILLLTFSRSSFLSLLSFSFVLYIIKKPIKKIYFVFIVLTIVALFSLVTMKRVKSDRMNYFNGSDLSRLSLNMAAVNMIKDHYVLGVGYENARFVLKKYADKRFPLVGELTSVHNVYLAVFAELGILGFGLFIFFYLLLFLDILRAYKRNTSYDASIYLLNIFIILSYLIHGLFYHYYFDRHVFWFLMIICLLSIRFEEEIRERFKYFIL